MKAMKAIKLTNLLLYLAVAGGRLTFAGDPSSNGPAAIAAGTGVIEGTVRYTGDPRHPWIFSRYYIQDPVKGWLAETVVALLDERLGRPIDAGIVRTQVMDQVNFQFVPETLAVQSGDAVRFLNSDDSVHSVLTADGPHPFNLVLGKGNEHVERFTRAGGLSHPIHIGCAFHGGMRAWIYVFSHRWFQVTEKDGRFRLEHVPAGNYTLGVMHPAGRLQARRPVAVRGGETTVVDLELTPDDLQRTH